MRFRLMGKLIDLTDVGFLELFLPFYGILIYYVLPKVGSVGQAVMLLYFAAYFVFSRSKKPEIPKWLFFFTVFTVPVQIMVFKHEGGFTFSRIVNLAMIVIYCYLLSYLRVNINGFIKIYKTISVIAAILILYQFYRINVWKEKVYQIMILPMKRPSAWYSGGIRPVGFFPEPQAFATFILPLLVICMQKGEYLWSMFISISIFFSTSTLGIICVAGVWMYYLLVSSLEMSKKIAIMAIIVVLFMTFTQADVFSYAFNKVLNTNYGSNVRLTRGFYILKKLSSKQLVFGIGVNNLEHYIQTGRIVLRDSITQKMSNKTYITTASSLLINFGVISTTIYCCFILNLLRNSATKLMVFLLIVLSFGQTILFSGVWLFYVLLIFCTLKEDNDCFFGLKIR